MPTKKKRPTYKGKLAPPMRPNLQPILLAAALIKSAENEKSGKASQHPMVTKREAAFEEQWRETLERMMLLFDHYGIEDRSNTPRKIAGVLTSSCPCPGSSNLHLLRV
jgi:hypothetical protein